MKKSQLCVAVISALSTSASFAGIGGISVSGVRTYATEVLTASTTATVATPSLAYSLTNPFAANTLPIIKLSLDNGAKFFTACPTLTVNKDSALASVVIPTSPATGTINATTGVVTCVYQPTAALTNSVPTNATLDFTSGTSTIGSLSGLTATSPISGTVAVFDAGGNPANDGNSAILVRAADAMAISLQNSANFTVPEQSQIDLLNFAGKRFTIPPATPTDNTGFPNLAIGAVLVSELPGAQFDAAATPVEVTFANLTTQTLDVVVNGTFITSGAPSYVFLTSDITCTNTFGPAPNVSTLAIPATPGTSLTLPTANITSVPAVAGVKTVYICYNVTTSDPIPPSLFSASAKFNSQTAVGPGNVLSAKVAATTNLYNLTFNAARVDLRQFWSTATSTANGGWVQLFRIINTSNTAAVVSGQYIAESTGALVGAPTALSTTALPAGAVMTMTAAQVEAAIGAPPAGIHRLRVTAPMPSIRVQSFLRDPGGRHTAIADQGAEGSNNAATGNR